MARPHRGHERTASSCRSARRPRSTSSPSIALRRANFLVTSTCWMAMSRRERELLSCWPDESTAAGARQRRSDRSASWSESEAAAASAGLPAIVDDLAFRGSDTLYRVRLQSGKIRAWWPRHSGDRNAFRPGDKVRVQIPPDACIPLSH